MAAAKYIVYVFFYPLMETFSQKNIWKFFFNFFFNNRHNFQILFHFSFFIKILKYPK